MNADDVIRLLDLRPLPTEGGYYRETYRASESIPREALPSRYATSRQFGTCIYYLLTAETGSALHRLASDEVFHFYLGDPVWMLQLLPGGESVKYILGPGIGRGENPQVVVPSGVWQGAMLVEGGRFALMGTTVAPGFDLRDYEHGDGERLTQEYPSRAQEIRRLMGRP